MNIMNIIIQFISVIVPMLISVAYFTLLERKVMAGIQRRRGPNQLGIIGILQPFSDGLKLFLKENMMPIKANNYLFIIAPILFLSVSLVNWSIIPLSENTVISDMHLGILYVLSLSSLSVYGLIIGGWSSNSQYSFLGGLRSAAQMISYEIAISLILFTVVVYAQSLNLSKIVISQEAGWLIYALFPIFIMFFVCSLAETSRTPFDLPEAEAELVSGYNVEYSSMGFAFFFIAEYLNIIFMSVVCVLLFLGGWLSPINLLIFNIIPSNVWFCIKIIIINIMFIWIRASFPRYRFDQLMALAWRIFLPISFSCVVVVIGISILNTINIEIPITILIDWNNLEVEHILLSSVIVKTDNIINCITSLYREGNIEKAKILYKKNKKKIEKKLKYYPVADNSNIIRNTPENVISYLEYYNHSYNVLTKVIKESAQSNKPKYIITGNSLLRKVCLELCFPQLALCRGMDTEEYTEMESIYKNITEEINSSVKEAINSFDQLNKYYQIIEETKKDEEKGVLLYEREKENLKGFYMKLFKSVPEDHKEGIKVKIKEMALSKKLVDLVLNNVYFITGTTSSNGIINMSGNFKNRGYCYSTILYRYLGAPHEQIQINYCYKITWDTISILYTEYKEIYDILS